MLTLWQHWQDHKEGMTGSELAVVLELNEPHIRTLVRQLSNCDPPFVKSQHASETRVVGKGGATTSKTVSFVRYYLTCFDDLLFPAWPQTAVFLLEAKEQKSKDSTGTIPSDDLRDHLFEHCYFDDGMFKTAWEYSVREKYLVDHIGRFTVTPKIVAQVQYLEPLSQKFHDYKPPRVRKAEVGAEQKSR